MKKYPLVLAITVVLIMIGTTMIISDESEGDVGTSFYVKMGYQQQAIQYIITSENPRTVSTGVGPDFSSDFCTVYNIPETVTYNGYVYTVTSIHNNGFTARGGAKVSGLTGVTMPDTITSIGNDAFYGCALTSVTIPENVTSIGTRAFCCSNGAYGFSLTTVNNNSLIPITADSTVYWSYGESHPGTINGQVSETEMDGITYKYNSRSKICAVIGCDEDITVADMSSVRIGGYSYCIKYIEEGVFENKTNIQSLSVGSGLKTIASDQFSGLISLTSLTIGSSIESIGSNAFRGCSNLTFIQFDAINCSALEIGTFYDAGVNGDGIDITVGNSVTVIPANIFNSGSAEHSPKITTLIIGDNVGTVGNGAFSYCDEVETLVIGNSMTSLSNLPISSSLVFLTIGRNITTVGEGTFTACTNLTDLTIPISTNAVGSNNNPAFRGCSNIREIRFTAGDGDSQDYDSNNSRLTPWYFSRSSLTNISFSDDIRSIGSFTLFENNCIDILLLPNNLESIGNYAFCGCSNLKSITIPGSVTSIGNYAFSGCSKLVSLTISDGITIFGGNNVFESCTSLTTVTIPDSVTTIPGSAFRYCSKLKAVYFSENSHLTTIEGGAFQYSALETITIPDSVIVIGGGAFDGCRLTTITIPENVTSISNSTFSHCNIKTITIPRSVTSIGFNAFQMCGELESVIFQEDSELTSIGQGAFSYCSSLKSITIPNGVTTIEDRAFAECSSLTSVMLPSSLNWIGSGIFNNNSGMRMIYVPADIQYCFDDSFSYFTFYDSDGTSILDNTDVQSLAGHYYSGTHDRLVKDNFLVSFIIDGILENTHLTAEGDVIDLYTKTGYTIEWTSSPFVEINNNHFTMPASGVYFYGISTPIKYRVSVNINGGSIDSIPDGWNLSEGVYIKDIDYKTSASSIEYLFRQIYKDQSYYEWSSNYDSVSAYGLEITAIWHTNRFTIHWLNEDGTPIRDSSVEYGSTPVYSWSLPTKSPTTTIAYVFTEWLTAQLTPLAPVTGEASYYAHYNSTTRLYNIRFDMDGNITTVLTEYGATPSAPNNPTKQPSTQYQYSFVRWSPSIESVTSDTTYVAEFSSSYRIYTINWLNHDSSVIRSDTFAYNSMPVYSGDTPVRASTQQYVFTFTGWDREVEYVSGNANYVAQYSQSNRQYTVTWTDDLGNELDSYSMAYGQMPSYSYADPTKQSTAEYSYTFSTWAPAISSVTGDVTYRAVFTPSKMSYTVTWMNYDGTVMLLENNVEYGTMPQYGGVTPSRNPTSQYVYEFTGWSPSIVAVTGATTYTAQYSQTLQTYTITWLNDDGSVLSRQNGVQYGTTPSYQGTPEKISTAQYDYSFARWSPAVVSVNGDATYTATFDRSVRSYNVVWKNYDGSILETYENVLYGTIPTFNGDTPIKPGTESERFTFFGWSPTVVAVTGDVVYTATYTSSEAVYTITWRNSNGSVLKIDRDVRYGTTPEFGGQSPSLPTDPQYEYTFASWSPAIAAVTDDAEYVAQYNRTLRTYTIRWYNDQGTLLLTDNDVSYGSRPSYSGGQMSKDSTAEYSYTFAGWSPQIVAVTGDASYTAVFTQEIRKYTITWRDGEGDTILVDTNVIYGSTPSFSGLTPTKLSTAEWKYTFNGWTPAVETVSGNAEYRATFTAEKQKYSVTWKDYNGTVLDIQNNLEYGTVPAYVGTAPSRANTAQYTYSFNGWSPAVTAVTGNVIYTATYSSTVNSYIITWKDANGHVLDVQNLLYGTDPVFAGQTPTKDPDVQYSYVFAGWSPEVRNVSESVVYMPVFDSVANTYTITWCDENGNTILTNEGLVYGAMPAYNGADPSKIPTAEYQYSFLGWYPSVTAVNGDASYRATFSSEIREYTITWKDESGTILDVTKARYGAVPSYTGTEPSKASTAQYDYYFNGWSPSLTAITGDVTYTAVYGSQTRSYSVTWLNYDGTTSEYDMNVLYGTHPTYDSAAPVKPANGYYEYRFVRWMNYSDSVTVTGDMTFTAVFEEYQVIFEIFFIHYNGEKTMVNYRLSSPVITEPDAYLGVPKGCAAYWSYYQLDGRPNNNVSLVCKSYLDYSAVPQTSSMVSANGSARMSFGDSGNVTVTGINSNVSIWYNHLGDERYIEIPDTTVDGKAVVAIDSLTDTQMTSLKLGTNVQIVKNGALSGCTNLKGFVVDENNNYLSEENGTLMSDSGKRLLCVANAAGETVQIPSTVSEVAPKAISGNTKTLVIDTRNSKIVFEAGANATDSDIGLVMAEDGNVIEMSTGTLEAYNAGVRLDVKSVDYLGEKDMTLTVTVTIIIIVVLVLQLISVTLVRNVDNANTWFFIVPAVLASMTMFVFMLYETVTLTVDVFFIVSVFAWLALSFIEMFIVYYAYICANKSRNASTIHKRGRTLMYAGGALGAVMALSTALLTYFDKLHVYKDAVPLLIIISAAIAATCLLGIIVSRKIFMETKIEQKKGLQL